jgi:hypothetical protein
VNDAVGINSAPPPADLFHQYLFKKKLPHPELALEIPDSSIFPFVVYRQQIARKIAGVDEPTPDTDIVQASHLVRNIIWDSSSLARPPTEPTEDAPPPGFAFFNDPWIGVARQSPTLSSLSVDLCYFDTTPVAAGSTYRYFLMHFDELGEPDGIIDAGTVTISE